MTTSAPPRGLPGFPAWGAGDWNLPRGLNGLQNIAKELFRHFFDLPSGQDTSSRGSESAFDFLWMLFTCSKQALLPPQPDATYSYALLLSCMNALLASTPPRATCLRQYFSSTQQFPRRAQCGAADTVHAILAVAPPLNRCLAATVAKLVTPLDAFLEEVLGPAGLVPCSSVEAHSMVPSVERTSSLSRVYVGLVSPNGVVPPAAFAALEEYYERTIKPDASTKGGIEARRVEMKEGEGEEEERPVLKAEEEDIEPRCAHFVTPSTHDTPSTAPPDLRLTAERICVNESQGLLWLREIAATEGGIAKTLASIVESEEDAGCCIARTAHMVHAAWTAIMPLDVSARHHDLAALYKAQTLALSTQVLSHLLLSERTRLGGVQGTPESVIRISRSESLMRSIVICSMQCVASLSQPLSNSTMVPPMIFPAVLDVLNADPFDLSKIIPSFVRALPTMPRDVKQVLVSLEERLVGDHVWRHGSSLFERLVEATSPLETSHMMSTSLPTMTSTSSTPPVVPAALGASGPSHGSSRAAYEMVFALLDKALKVVYLRLKDLTGRLQLSWAGEDGTYDNSQLVLQQAFTAVRHIATDHTWLLYGRTLDHVILSTLYGICRANRIFAATFKSIITAYKSQHHACQDIIRWVSMAGPPPASPVPRVPEAGVMFPAMHPVVGSDTNAVDDIIAFYNRIFLPETTALLQGIADGTVPLLDVQAITPLSPEATMSPVTAHIRGPPATTPSQGRLQLVPSGITPKSGGNVTSPAVKLSRGRWVVSPRGTRLVTPANPWAETATQVPETLGATPLGSGVRRKRVRSEGGDRPPPESRNPRCKSGGTTGNEHVAHKGEIPGRSAAGAGGLNNNASRVSPTVALLAAVANAEDEFCEKKNSGDPGTVDVKRQGILGGVCGMLGRNLSDCFDDAAGHD